MSKYLCVKTVEVEEYGAMAFYKDRVYTIREGQSGYFHSINEFNSRHGINKNFLDEHFVKIEANDE